MNYSKLYFAFIEKYKNQVIDAGVYTEKHHIVPRHAGGDDSKDNIVTLTFRQHLFIHRLRWKAYGELPDLFAFNMMSGWTEERKRNFHSEIGKRNVESGHLERIRVLANTPERKRKHKLQLTEKAQSGALKEMQLLANEAWRGSFHTEEFKLRQSENVKARLTDPENYKKQIYYASLGRQVKVKMAEEKSALVIINAERNTEFLQEKSVYSKNIFISPEGLEFDSPIYAAKYYGKDVNPITIESWCKRFVYGWSRKPKTLEA